MISSAQTLNFLLGVQMDHKGRKFSDMLAFSDEKMEKCDEQIQWMFPLHEKSKYAEVYPILTKDVTDIAKNDPTIIGNMVLAKRRMEKFYGLPPYEDVEKQKSWCNDDNHNLLRVTRIIRSLRLLGLEDEARIFYDKVFKVGYQFDINQRTLDFWQKAIRDDVWASLQ